MRRSKDVIPKKEDKKRNFMNYKQGKATNPKDLIGQKKTHVALFPMTAVLVGATAMEDGASKYGAYNYRKTDIAVMNYVSAALRHIIEYMNGNEFTDDTGVHNLAGAMASIAIIIDAGIVGRLIDDRPEYADVGTLIKILSEHKVLKTK